MRNDSFEIVFLGGKIRLLLSSSEDEFEDPNWISPAYNQNANFEM